MLTQSEADYLIKALKELKTKRKSIEIPAPNTQSTLKARSMIKKDDTFVFYMNRKGQYKLSKCTYVLRYKNIQNLLRIDLEGPPHDNPDGTVVKCPHIHIYKEGYNLSWAYPLNDKIPTDPSNLITVLIDFLKYTNVNNKYTYTIQEGGLV